MKRKPDAYRYKIALPSGGFAWTFTPPPAEEIIEIDALYSELVARKLGWLPEAPVPEQKEQEK